MGLKNAQNACKADLKTAKSKPQKPVLSEVKIKTQNREIKPT